MGWLRRLSRTIVGSKGSADFDEEARFHLEQRIHEYSRSGMSPDEAKRAATRRLGSLTLAKEQVRDADTLRWLADLGRDAWYALRMLRKHPGFATMAVLTLALGIGANTAIFSIINGVVLRPLDYPRPGRLMFLTTRFPALGFTQFWVSPPEYLEYRAFNQSFADVGAYTTGEVNLLAGDRPIRVRSALVDEHLLNVLGLRAEQGRLFRRGETDVSGPPPASGQPPPEPPAIVIVSHELWQTALGGQPIVGRTVQINGRSNEVIGIMPPGADLMDNRTDVWLPLGLNPANRRNRGSHYLYLIGRLKNGVTQETADAELASLMETWSARVGLGPQDHRFSSLSNRSGSGGAGGHILQMAPLQVEMLGGAGRVIWLLQAAVAVVLLIACANLGSLVLARAEARHQEFALRTALGASRGRLLRLLMTEGVLLSLAGGLLGLLLASMSIQAIVRAYPASLPRTRDVSVDWAVLVFTGAISMATGALFGLAPLAHVRLKRPLASLKEGAARSTGGLAHARIRRGLVIGEIALAVVLVAGAGLLVRTVGNLTRVDAGFDRSHLATFALTLPQVDYPRPLQRAQTFTRLLERLRALPGVVAATAMSGLPPVRPVNANSTDISNYTAPPEGPFENVDYYQYVMSDYFETMGIPIVQGRPFQQTDAASQGMVAVVNETLVNTFWKGRNPIGQQLRPGGGQVPWFTIVGVAKDVKQGGVDQKTGTEVYFFVDQASQLPSAPNIAPGTMNIVLRTTRSPAELSADLTRAVHRIDPTLPIVLLRSMNEVFDDAIRRPRLLADLVGAFGGLALLLAVVGTYGVLAYTVAERRREIGIRMALGAHRARVLGQILREGLLLTAVGIGLGLAGAIVAGRLMTSLLFGITPTDAATLGGVAAIMVVAAGAACGLPAWRASRLDPMLVLREE